MLWFSFLKIFCMTSRSFSWICVYIFFAGWCGAHEIDQQPCRSSHHIYTSFFYNTSISKQFSFKLFPDFFTKSISTRSAPKFTNNRASCISDTFTNPSQRCSASKFYHNNCVTITWVAPPIPCSAYGYLSSN